MAEYRSIYKCRLCGEAFEDCVTGKSTAQMAIVAVAINGNTDGVVNGGHMHKHTMHFCKDGSFGFADFQGFKKVGE